MRKLVLILTVIFLTVSGCGYSDMEKIEQTVRDYKTTYILARNNGKWYVADINFKEEILKTEEAK